MKPSEVLHLYGNTEVEEGEEIHLHKQLTNCKKNPGHQQFMPIKDFTIEHLPEGYHDQDLYDLIKATANLTVRIGVQKFSPDRPEFWPDTKVPYPCYNKRENVKLISGTGTITVFKYIDGHGYDGHGKRNNPLTRENIESEYKTCPCDKCVDSDMHNNVWWEIYVHTAKHVVFDEIEANHSACRLFYDSDDTDDSPLVKLNKFGIEYTNIDRDRCVMKYVTCEAIGKQLFEMKVQCCALLEKVWNKYLNRSDVIFIVSHPHGCSKQVSVGHLLDNQKLGEYNENIHRTKMTYTTETCQGSSGAQVNCVGSVAGGHVHTGSFDSGLNYSSVGYFFRK